MDSGSVLITVNDGVPSAKDSGRIEEGALEADSDGRMKERDR